MEQYGAEVHPDTLRQLRAISEDDLVKQQLNCNEGQVSNADSPGYDVEDPMANTGSNNRQITPSLVHTVAHNQKDDISNIIINNLEALMSNSYTQEKLRDHFDTLKSDMALSLKLGGDVCNAVFPQYDQVKGQVLAKERLQVCMFYSKSIQYFCSYGDQIGALLASQEVLKAIPSVYYEDTIGKHSIKHQYTQSQHITHMQQVMLSVRLYCLKHKLTNISWSTQGVCKTAWKAYSDATSLVYTDCSNTLRGMYLLVSTYATEETERKKALISVRCMYALKLQSQLRLNIESDPISSPLSLVVGDQCKTSVDILSQGSVWVERGLTDASLSYHQEHCDDAYHGTSVVLIQTLRRVLYSVVEMATSAIPATDKVHSPVNKLFPDFTITSSNYSRNGYLSGAIGVLPVEKAKELQQCQSLWLLYKSLSATQSIWVRFVFFLDLFVSTSCLHQTLHAWLANGSTSPQYPDVQLVHAQPSKNSANDILSGGAVLLSMYSSLPFSPEQVIPTTSTPPHPCVHPECPTIPSKSLLQQCIVEAALRHEKLVFAPHTQQLPVSFVHRCVTIPNQTLICTLFATALQSQLSETPSTTHPLLSHAIQLSRLTQSQFQEESTTPAVPYTTVQDHTTLSRTLGRSYVRLSFAMHDVVKRVLLPPIAVHSCKVPELDEVCVLQNVRLDILYRSVYSPSVFPALVLGEQPLHPFAVLFDVLEKIIQKQKTGRECRHLPVTLLNNNTTTNTNNSVEIPVYNYGQAATTATSALSLIRKRIIHATSALFSLYSTQVTHKLNDACNSAFPAQQDHAHTASNMLFHLDDRAMLGPAPVVTLPHSESLELLLDHTQHLLKTSLPGPRSLKLHLTKTQEVQTAFIISRQQAGIQRAQELAPTLRNEVGPSDDQLLGAAGVAGKAMCMSMLTAYETMEEREATVRNSALEQLVKTQISTQLQEKMVILRAAVLAHRMVSPSFICADIPAYQDADLQQPLLSAAGQLQSFISTLVRSVFGDAKNQILKIAHLQQHYPVEVLMDHNKPPRPVDIARHCFSFLRKRVIPAMQAALQPEFNSKQGPTVYTYPEPILTDSMNKLITTTLPQIIKQYTVMNAAHAQQVSLPCIFGQYEWITKNIQKPLEGYKGAQEAQDFMFIIQEYAQLHRLEKIMVCLYLSLPATHTQRLTLQHYSCVKPFLQTTKGAMLLFLVLSIHTHLQTCMDVQQQLSGDNITHIFKNSRSNDVLLNITNTYLKTSWKNQALKSKVLGDELQKYQSSKDLSYNIRNDPEIEQITQGHTGLQCVQYLCQSIGSTAMTHIGNVTSLDAVPEAMSTPASLDLNTTDMELMPSMDANIDTPSYHDDALNISTTLGAV